MRMRMSMSMSGTASLTLTYFKLNNKMTVSKARAAAIIIMVLLERIKNRKNKRRLWVRKWIKRREIENTAQNLVHDLRNEGTGDEFRKFFRMSPQQFDILLEKVRPFITKKDTNFRKAISVETRLTITIRFLASGDSYRSLMLLFRVPHNTISGIVAQTCRAIHIVLSEYLQVKHNSNIHRKLNYTISYVY